jgi:drug/metabolite transporter (DMT)-like permease
MRATGRGGTRSLAALSGAAAATIVGSSTAVSASLVRYPVLTGQALRYGVAAVILLALLRWRGGGAAHAGRPVRLTARQFARLVALAATGLVGFNVCLIDALRSASPAAVGSVVGSAPVVLALAGPLLARRRPHGRTLLAAVVVVAGAAIVQGLGDGSLTGLLLALGALAGEVGFSLLAVPLLPLLGTLRLSAYLTVVATPMLAIVALLAQGGGALVTPSLTEAAALLYLAVVVTAGAFLLWYFALARLGPARAGLLLGLMPVSAAVGAAVVGTGPLTAAALLGSGLVGLGVAVGLLPAGPARATPSADPIGADGEPRAQAPAQAAPQSKLSSPVRVRLSSKKSG